MEDKRIVTIPTFLSDDPYQEGAAYLQWIRDPLLPVTAEDRIHFKVAVYACWQRLTSKDPSEVSRVPAFDLLERLWELNELRIVVKGLGNRLKVAIDMKQQFRDWAAEIQTSDVPWSGDQIATMVRKFLNEP